MDEREQARGDGAATCVVLLTPATGDDDRDDEDGTAHGEVFGPGATGVKRTAL